MKVIITKVAFPEDDCFVGMLGDLDSCETEYYYAVIKVSLGLPPNLHYRVPVLEYTFPNKLMLALF